MVVMIGGGLGSASSFLPFLPAHPPCSHEHRRRLSMGSRTTSMARGSSGIYGRNPRWRWVFSVVLELNVSVTKEHIKVAGEHGQKEGIGSSSPSCCHYTSSSLLDPVRSSKSTAWTSPEAAEDRLRAQRLEYHSFSSTLIRALLYCADRHQLQLISWMMLSMCLMKCIRLN